jgi:2-dehydro-3-deoxygluconokinase
LGNAASNGCTRGAKKHGTVVSYDLNYRPSLWKAVGGQARATEINREIAKHVDVMIGNEEDFTMALGFQVEGLDEHISQVDPANFKKMIAEVTKMYPNFRAVGNTLRGVKTATVNDWSAILWCEGEFYQAKRYADLEVYDRVGGGDSFASGLAFGLMETGDLQKAVEYGAAHGALAMTTPGDTSMATRKEVEALMGGGSARVQR